MEAGMKKEMDVREEGKQEAKATAMRVSVVSVAVNLVLSLLKLLAGIFANSGAMISDAIHSASDVFSTFIVMIGVNVSSKASDEEHQYGHDRLECVASIVLAVILAITGVGIGISGAEKILGTGDTKLEVPGLFALFAAVLSILVKEWMYWYTRGAAKKINSGALMADAWHHRSDALSSIGALIGIAGARLGYPVLDPIASVVICIFVIKASYDIFKDAIDKMVDKSCDEETEEKIRTLIRAQEGVIRVDLLRTRLFGAMMYVDVEIACDGTKPLSEAHAVAERVHDAIETEFPTVKHCMVHVNPAEECACK
ncbi:MAG: cation diffusion facilitator family transporter [Lachnospiraceae bacterium]|nr:cation diffusion facilitator family transporter [Lachnospiraceae bacterium]